MNLNEFGSSTVPSPHCFAAYDGAASEYGRTVGSSNSDAYPYPESGLPVSSLGLNGESLYPSADLHVEDDDMGEADALNVAALEALGRPMYHQDVYSASIWTLPVVSPATGEEGNQDMRRESPNSVEAVAFSWFHDSRDGGDYMAPLVDGVLAHECGVMAQEIHGLSQAEVDDLEVLFAQLTAPGVTDKQYAQLLAEHDYSDSPGSLVSRLRGTGVQIKIIDSPEDETLKIETRRGNRCLEDTSELLKELDVDMARQTLGYAVELQSDTDQERDAIMAGKVPKIAELAAKLHTRLAVVCGARHDVMDKVEGATSQVRNTQGDRLLKSDPLTLFAARHEYRAGHELDEIDVEVNRVIIAQCLYGSGMYTETARQVVSDMTPAQIHHAITTAVKIYETPNLSPDERWKAYKPYLQSLVTG